MGPSTWSYGPARKGAKLLFFCCAYGLLLCVCCYLQVAYHRLELCYVYAHACGTAVGVCIVLSSCGGLHKHFFKLLFLF